MSLLYCKIYRELHGEEHSKDEKEEYYLLWKECGLAEQLRGHDSQNTATEHYNRWTLQYVHICILKMHTYVHEKGSCLYTSYIFKFIWLVCT